MEKEISNITSLIGDPIRTAILWTLLDNRAYTATELAITVNTSAQNISMHLHKLVQASLLVAERQGRHKYYKFSKPEVAYAMEAISNLLPNEQHKKITDSKNHTAIKYCRTCYDHLAGKVGVLLTEALLQQKIIVLEDKLYHLTKKGTTVFNGWGIDIALLKKQRRIFAKPCLDWSERKHHLAGSLGAALLEMMLANDYIRRIKNSRAVIFTAKGEIELHKKCNLIVTK
jgi:DNA-binding transcriptional ArsR family regulator